MIKQFAFFSLISTLAACGSADDQSFLDHDDQKNNDKPEVAEKKPIITLNKSSKNSLNTVTIDDKKIELHDEINSKPLYPWINSYTAKINGDGDVYTKIYSGNAYKYSRFGLFVDSKAPFDSPTLVVNHGVRTTLMPRIISQATYSGHYASYNEDTSRGEVGIMEAYVDFSEKKLALKTTQYLADSISDLNDINSTSGVKKTDNIKEMQGSISGNAFLFDNGKGRGYFYGPQAVEMGGVHKNANEVMTFGARKSPLLPSLRD